MFDLIIKNGKIIDGTGNPWFKDDIGIKKGMIETIGNLSIAKAKEIIDLNNLGKTSIDYRNLKPSLVVSPGFIDVHTHSDDSILTGKLADSMIMQGVITLTIGNCGKSLAPVNKNNKDLVLKWLDKIIDSEEVNWNSYGEYLSKLDKVGLVNNIVPLVGHDAIRRCVMGSEERTALPDEIKKMGVLLEESLEFGAAGLSTGLEFSPGRSANEEELEELVFLVAKHNGVYASHIRNRDQFYEEAVTDALQLARKTRVKFQFSHLNYKVGASEGIWKRVMEMVERTRELEGLDITTECTSYRYGPGSYLALFPEWFLKDGLEMAIEKIKDKEIRNKLRVDCDRYWRYIHRGEWDRVMLTNSITHPELIGKTFEEISEIQKKDPWDCFFDVLADEGKNVESGFNYVMGWNFDESHIREQLIHPLFMFHSDARAMSAKGKLAEINRLPASLGWAPRILGNYVRQEKLLSLEEAIRKMTSMPCQKFNLKKRGILKEGMIADITIFNPASIQDLSSPLFPNRYPEGIEYVIIGGEIVVRNGEYNEKTVGRVLR
ncbi:MAG: amidohydrolase family protein, partial [Actinobacteria bacterium]|nr:amidohydrolase family protein [Actinomycetota bacterium]